MRRVANSGEFQWQSARAQIYRWAYRLLQNEHDALDATQTVLVKAVGAIREARPPQGAWLRRVTINSCIDMIRRRDVAARFDLHSRQAYALPDVLQAEQGERIAAALEHLTDVQRVVLLAKACDDESFADIAAMLDISASTVRTHYVRALRKMQVQLAPSEGDRQ